ncbi:unnamed protein product [Schistosoma margrebowiei]|uniref:Uncharacterized protein n=1 Tax=Schistosoma margrebowiei TaxID=48269 RepID=A0AA84ZVP3_9TREM|nr:unnamed protein product [Schistosoma margrebowiei]
MADLDISELGISKNLLQMNFMRRTLVAKEKATNQSAPDILPNSQEYGFKLPSSVEKHINKRATILKSKYRYQFVKSIFKLYNVSPGFRESFGGFNSSTNANAIPQSLVKNLPDSRLPNRVNSVCEYSQSSECRASKTSIRFKRFEERKPSKFKNPKHQREKKKKL